METCEQMKERHHREERELLFRAMEASEWNSCKAAKMLGILTQTIYLMLKRHPDIRELFQSKSELIAKRAATAKRKLVQC